MLKRVVENHRADTVGNCFANAAGTIRIGDEEFEFGPRDVFVAPSWQPVSHDALEDAVLFSFSDRAAQKALGVWREDGEPV